MRILWLATCNSPCGTGEKLRHVSVRNINYFVHEVYIAVVVTVSYNKPTCKLKSVYQFFRV
jgi:hypothetical protein